METEPSFIELLEYIINMTFATSHRTSSYTRRIFIAFILVIIFLYLLHYTAPQSRIFSLFGLISQESTTDMTNGLPKSIQNTRGLCELSVSESDGWFCEFSEDWKRRKQLHQERDKLNRHSNAYAGFFINNWKPTVQCAFEQRIGSRGDGGKWVCDVRRLERDDYVPVIYSFGSQGEFSFEQEIKKILPKADIHTFDSAQYACPSGVCTFHRAMIGDGIESGTKSLKMVIDELGHQHRQIDILKIDIEGGEYKTFGKFFKHPQNSTSNTIKKSNEPELPYIRQILIEIHTVGAGTSDNRTAPMHELFELFRFNNYVIFHKEVNPVVPNDAYEYAFLRLNPKFFISP